MLIFNFESARKDLFQNGYTQLQVDTINAIATEANRAGMTNINQLAYVYATAWHECYNPKIPSTRITPMREIGGESYLKSKKYYPYVGMGIVQLTWEENYKKYAPKVKELFGVDIMKNPNALLRVDVASYVAINGMTLGRFTGKKLSDYITDSKTDFFNARRIINGTDEAQKIANYAVIFAKHISKIPSVKGKDLNIDNSGKIAGIGK